MCSQLDDCFQTLSACSTPKDVTNCSRMNQGEVAINPSFELKPPLLTCVYMHRQQLHAAEAICIVADYFR